jgi:valyl-tRNA synthetase
VKLRLDFEASQRDGESASQRDERLAKTKAALTTLVQVFEASLRMLSPFMPFLTEEIWHALYDGKTPAKSIALTAYPQAEESLIDEDARLEMRDLMLLITELRAVRKDLSVPESEVVPAYVLGVNMGNVKGLDEWGGRRTSDALVNRNGQIIEKLARVNPIRSVDSENRYGTLSTLYWRQGMFEIAVSYERTIDVVAETERLRRDIAKYEKGLAAAARQLGNEGFLAKAPAQVVEGLKKQAAETQALLDKAQAALAALPKA